VRRDIASFFDRKWGGEENKPQGHELSVMNVIVVWIPCLDSRSLDTSFRVFLCFALFLSSHAHLPLLSWKRKAWFESSLSMKRQNDEGSLEWPEATWEDWKRVTILIGKTREEKQFFSHIFYCFWCSLTVLRYTTILYIDSFSVSRHQDMKSQSQTVLFRHSSRKSCFSQPHPRLIFNLCPFTLPLSRRFSSLKSMSCLLGGSMIPARTGHDAFKTWTTSWQGMKSGKTNKKKERKRLIVFWRQTWIDGRRTRFFLPSSKSGF
jgi:hypothetical protein